ncbi:hypothetical protein BJ912DRAFT_1022838 [Pholiota molesta]|nr:hypothetical protein BJ912DRAFT_1022838 [Pholiota molesta]
MDLKNLVYLANQNPEILNGETLLKISTFLSYAPRFKDDIILVQPSQWPVDVAPQHLPQSVMLLLSNLCEITEEETLLLWSMLNETIWKNAVRMEKIDERFKVHGKDLGYTVIYPPQHYCTNSGCSRNSKGLKLNKVEQTRAILYTLDRGACPAWIVKYFCEGCQTSYHNNYRVHAGKRYYYSEGMPDVLEVSDHHFIETRVAVMWCTDTNIAAKSFTNCARSYMVSLANNLENIPPNWPFKASLKGDHVFDAFTILSLMDDHRERHAILTVPHTGDQSKRFITAIQERNIRMRLCSQPEVRHRCTKCTRQYNDKIVWVAVMDGTALGHLRCSVHNCQTPLTVSRDRFCPNHRQLNNICAIKGCDNSIIPKTRTCQDPVHQNIEKMHTLKGQSRFQLQERLRKAGVSHLVLDTDEASDVSPAALYDDTAEDQEFEQILVAPCGMILARETFYGAEAISTCAEFIRRTFRINGMMPNHIFFDNNCSLSKHVKDDPMFANVGLTVDVFHFNCKHSIRDEYCQSNCNPAMYRELYGEGDKAWYFNSSIAEQTNVWLGTFNPIVREMLPDRYNFFLDQMILLRNRMTRDALEKEGFTLI